MDEIQVLDDALGWVRRHPDRFFRSAVPNEFDLVGRVVTDVVYMGGAAHVSKHGHWWLVSSACDWLRHDGIAREALFTRVVPIPAQGHNSMRAEVLVAAFATRAAFLADGGWHTVKGAPPGVELGEALMTHPDVGCALAFIFGGEDDR